MKKKCFRKKKILFVKWGVFEYDGVLIRTYNLYKYMNLENFDIDLYAFGSVQSKEVFDEFCKLGVNIIMGNHKGFNRKEVFHDLNELIKLNKYDVVHCNTGGLELTAITMFAAWINRVPVRIAHSANQKLVSRPYGKRELIYQLINTKLSTVRLTCSIDAAKHLFGQRGSLKSYVLKNGIEYKKYLYNQVVRDNIRAELGVADSLVVGHIGRFENQKNHKFLIDIFYSIKKKRNDAVLLLIGKGRLIDEIKEKVRRLGIEDSVIFLGTTDRVQDYLQAMDIFLLPSVSEGLGIVAIESQAADLLTICSDTVPPEARVTSRIKYYSLEKSAEQWSDMILNEYEKIVCDNRIDRSQDIIESGYDINSPASELYRIYINGSL